jgi:N-acetylneuraminate synthase
MIEKHITLDRTLPGPDHSASLEPAELGKMVQTIRDVEMALGSAGKEPTPTELKNRAVARKSLVAGMDIAKGELFTSGNLTTKRPGTGLSPMQYWSVLGTRAHRDFKKDELIS